MKSRADPPDQSGRGVDQVAPAMSASAFTAKLASAAQKLNFAVTAIWLQPFSSAHAGLISSEPAAATAMSHHAPRQWTAGCPAAAW